MSFGSGTLVDVRENVGLIVTNWHVVVDAAGPVMVVFPNGFQSPARVLMTDKDWDLAALAIWKPDLPPVPIASAAPILGEPLAIAGYGSGNWRMAVGKCNQYVAPAENLPYEMVEVSAEARQGDSGGPIFNARGELAGVLFGASRGTTSGSYAGRVRMFLQPILDASAATIPAEEQNLAANSPPAPSNETPVAMASLPESSNASTLSSPSAASSNVAFDPTAVPTREPETAATAEELNEQQVPVYDSAPPARVSNKVPSLKDGWDDPLPGEIARRTMPLADQERMSMEVTPEVPAVRTAPAPANAADDPRVASIAPNMGPVQRLDAADAGLVHTPLPPRPGTTAATATSLPFTGLPALSAAEGSEPWKQLWYQIAGRSPLDQGKTILAALGILTVLYRFMGRDKDDEVEE